MFTPGDYLHPRYWLSWLGFGLLRLISLLPLPIIAMMGSALGSLVFYLMKSRRQIAVQNLAACFPELSEQDHLATAKRCFQLIATTTLSMGINWWASPARLQRLVNYEGRDHYEQAIAQGRNIILLAPHAIALEMGALLLSRERSMITMYQHTRKKLLNDIVKDRRGRFGGILVERREPLRALLKLIRSGKPFYYLPDQDAGEKACLCRSLVPMPLPIPCYQSLPRSVMLLCCQSIRISCPRVPAGVWLSVSHWNSTPAVMK